VTSVAVVAHRKKSFDGGLDELRSVLAHEGVEPLWYEVPKSKKAPKAAREAVEEGAELVFVWGGDGTVQRCVDELVDDDVDLAILPAGTANLLANNLGVPLTLAEAVQCGLHGDRRSLDVGTINGERFMVMCGAGLDALMIKDADRGLKDKVGRLAYVWTGLRHVKARRVPMTIEIDDQPWFDGEASCVLAANVSTIIGGLAPFETARPDDGVLEIGVVEAEGALQWARVFGRMAVGQVERSPLTRTTSARKVKIKAAEKIPYELDGGDRGKSKKITIEVEPGAVRICVPPGADR
jgi:YegS/Rv2252/BmrU family lipid kinase